MKYLEIANDRIFLAWPIRGQSDLLLINLELKICGEKLKLFLIDTYANERF